MPGSGRTIRFGAAGACLAVLVAGVQPAPAQEEASRSVAEALAGGKVAGKLRYRYEFVDDDGFSENANASTLLFRLNYETASWRNWSAFAEFDYTFELWPDDFNSGAGTSGTDRDIYPVVADPAGADLNQLFFQYAPDEQARLRIGRQRLLLNDQRFVGGVGWRQNEQTYDAMSLAFDRFPDTSIFYAYVINVARIFGSSVPAGNQEQSTHLLNVRYTIRGNWNLTGYGYLIDNDDAPTFSTNTFGIRASGAIKLGASEIDLLGEFAWQSDAGNAPVDFETDYLRARAVWSFDPVSVGAGIERLGSDNGESFRTPLATLHAFNGWADRFLTIPPAGLVDTYLRLGYDYKAWKLALIYHDFEADAGGEGYGKELDLQATRPLLDRVDLLIKLAAFDGDSAAFEDSSKFWVMLTAGF